MFGGQVAHRIARCVRITCAALLVSGVARSDLTCPAAAERGQELRAAGKLLEARDAFIRCGSDRCSKVVQRDCAQWLSEVERDLPSLLVVASASGKDVLGAEVQIDEVRVEDTTRATPLNPGPHRVVVTARGYEPSEQSVLVRVGDRNRRVDFALTTVAPARIHLARVAPDRDDTSTPAGPWVMGGIGALGLSAFAALQAVARVQLSDLDACGVRGTCDPSDVSTTRTLFVASGVGLVAGLTSLAAATIWYFAARH